jgi:hypothetical protein
MGLKSLIKRITKGSPLTHTEVDDNWQAIEDTFQTPTDSDIGKVPVLNPDKETFSYAVKTDLALGETASTAYRGDRGKTAYDHSQTSGNPHGTNKSDVGLGNVDNTSDFNKPVSNAMQIALDLKKDKTAYAVKFGSAQKLGYVCDQAVNTLEIMRNAPEYRSTLDFDTYCLWLGIERVNMPNKLSEIASVIFKQKLETWARKCREMGINPVVRLSKKT